MSAITPTEKTRWLSLSGRAGPSRPGSEEFCQQLLARGLVTLTTEHRGERYYALTDAGKTAVYGARVATLRLRRSGR